jgi:hypothetical protein
MQHSFPVAIACQRHGREQAAAGLSAEALARPELLPAHLRALLDRHNAMEAAALDRLDAALDQSQVLFYLIVCLLTPAPKHTAHKQTCTDCSSCRAACTPTTKRLLRWTPPRCALLVWVILHIHTLTDMRPNQAEAAAAEAVAQMQALQAWHAQARAGVGPNNSRGCLFGFCDVF